MLNIDILKLQNFFLTKEHQKKIQRQLMIGATTDWSTSYKIVKTNFNRNINMIILQNA